MILVGLVAFSCSMAVESRADLVVQGRLVEEGRDVTKEHPDAVLILIKQDDSKPDQREVVRCVPSTLCDVPPGLYLVSVDAPDLVAEGRPVLTVEKDEPKPLLLNLNVVRSANVEIPGGYLPVGSFLSAVDEKTGVIYSRDVKGPTARVRVPGRPIILCAFEAESKAIGCQRVLPKPGETVTLSGFATPARGRGQLYVGLVYSSEDAPYDLSVALRLGEKKLPPDVVTAHSARVYAIWFDAPAGTGSLDLSSKFWTTASAPRVEVPERKTAVQMRIPLVRKPSLKVSFLGGEVLGAGNLEIDLFACEKFLDLSLPPPIPMCSLVATESGPAARTFLFNNLSPGAYAARWKKAPFESATWIDMRDAKSREESLPIELIEVRGRVTKRGKGVAGRLRWEAINSGGVYTTRSDEGGAYVLQVAQKGPYGVGVLSDDGRSYGKDLVVGDSRTFDIEIPANQVVFRVVTMEGKPVPAARVGYEVTAPPPDGLQKDVGERRSDPEGKATLPPLPAGILTARVSAEGFRPADIPPSEITEKTNDKEIVVTLVQGAAIRLHILDPAGSPAAKAMIWSDTAGVVADDSGTAVFENPLSPGAPLVTFDARGSMGFFRYSGEPEQTLRIPLSGLPVVVRFLTPDGTPLKGENVIVGIDGILDSKRFLNQALWSGGDFSSRADGSQRIAGLPAEGALTIYPYGRPDLAVTRSLPVTIEIVFALPLPATTAR